MTLLMLMLSLFSPSREYSVTGEPQKVDVEFAFGHAPNLRYMHWLGYNMATTEVIKVVEGVVHTS